MKLDLRTMDVASPAFNFVRALSTAGTGGAEINECLLVAEHIKDGDPESWIAEWLAVADRTVQAARRVRASGDVVTARGAFMRTTRQP